MTPTDVREWRVRGFVNAPERTDKTKRSLFAPVRRSRALLRWRRRREIAFLGTAESGSVLASVAEGRRRVRALFAPADSIIRGHHIGKGAVVDRTQFDVLDRAYWYVPLTGRRRKLAFLDVLLADAETGHREVAIVAHYPRNTAKVDPGGRARAAIDAELSKRCSTYRAAGLPVAVYVDRNGARPPLAGFKVVSSHGPDAIYAAGFEVDTHGADDLSGVSDHHAVWARMRPRVAAGAARRLPATR